VRSLPIGMLDSGVGGLTVARAVIDQLPHESLLYLGDTANGPYGPLPLAEIRGHALAAMDRLVGLGVKMLVISCNTASAACLHEARERYDIPVVEVVEPAVRRAVAVTHNRCVGVIGTIATIDSRAYEDAFAALPGAGIEVTTAACPRLVDFVERGITTGRQVLGLTESYLAPLLAADIDTMILGCTHYPLLSGMFSLVVGDRVTLVSSAEETAKDVYRTLVEHDLLRDEGGPDGGADDSPEPPTYRFLASGDPAVFARHGRRFLGPELAFAEALGVLA
jgi:glutamate racemase